MVAASHKCIIIAFDSHVVSAVSSTSDYLGDDAPGERRMQPYSSIYEFNIFAYSVFTAFSVRTRLTHTREY